MKDAKCLAKKNGTSNIIELEDKSTEGTILYKTVEFGKEVLNDCEWTYNKIRIYEDGRYEDEFRLYDKGTIFGDNFWWAIIIYINTDVRIADWWNVESLGAGETKADIQKGLRSAIRDHYSRIDYVGYTRVCD